MSQMSDAPEELDRMYIAYDSGSGQVNQVLYHSVYNGMWTRLFGEWRQLSEDDETTFAYDLSEIARKYFQQTRDFFDDSIKIKGLTYEPNYRMWYA